MCLTPRLSLQTLPTEILEDIIVAVVASGSAETVAAVAATCRNMFNAVYKAEDQHLWRSIYRTIFDDPRNLRGRCLDLNWKSGFTDRVWTRRFIKQRLQRSCHPFRRFPAMRYHLGVPGLDTGHIKSWQTLSSIISTSLRATSQPICSRVALVRSDQPSLVQLHRETTTWPTAVQSTPPSNNITWLRGLLVKGLPSALIDDLILQRVAWFAGQRCYPFEIVMSQSAVVTLLGSLPPSDPEEDQDPPADPPSPTPQHEPGDLLILPQRLQCDRALSIARGRVFDMRYVSPRRNWGPYLRVPPETPEDEEEEVDSNDSDDDVEMDAPSADQLSPDWEWLCSARIIAESLLRDYHCAKDVRKLEDWDNLREGTSLLPEDDSESSNATIEAGSPAGMVDRRAERSSEHDWAGAEGVWRRMICWVPYDELVEPGWSADFSAWTDPRFEEQWLIVPLSLRITGYSPSPLGEYADRPTIHVEGEIGGRDWLEAAALAGFEDQDVRRVHGTVSMLADGSVRWSLTSKDQDGTEDEMTSETIQLGGLGSAMGSLGMWTYASHEEGDSIELIWQWRVG
ncbi:hypothetical protein FKP32DRAFT_1586153 [Trametes sanguinea]|nr:hypothetical protein FKP32DRAFT_1586153 [Trametes sanguinea]